MRCKSILLLLLAVMLAMPACTPALAEDASALRGYSKAGGYDYVYFGSYPTEADGTVKPILWRVLKIEQGTAYLLSELILFSAPVHGDYDHYNGWENSDLYAYLNNVFINDAFSPEEQSALAVRTEDNALVTLITSDEMKDASLGFSSNNARLCESTAWAKILPNPPIFELPATNNKGKWKPLYIYSKGKKYSPWWSRTRSDEYKHEQRRVMDEGKIGRISTGNSDLGVRPAIHVDLSLLTILSGDGTFTSPYVLSPLIGGQTEYSAAQDVEENQAAPVPTDAPAVQTPPEDQPAPVLPAAVPSAEEQTDADDSFYASLPPVDDSLIEQQSMQDGQRSSSSVSRSGAEQTPAEPAALPPTQAPAAPAPTQAPALVSVLATVSPEELALFFGVQPDSDDATNPGPAAAATPAPQAQEPAPASTEAPAQEPIPEPTAEPAPEPAPEPAADGPFTAAARPENIHEKFPALTSRGFLPDGEEEFVYVDENAGLWLYASQTLRIEINRRTGTNSNREPLRWYEAQIFTKDENERFDFFPYDKDHYTSYGDRYKAPVDKIAVQHHVVFAMNSDYFIYRIERDHEESYNYPIGVIIRDGEVLYDRPKKKDTTSYPPLDVMALYPDGTVSLHLNGTMTAKEFLKLGATDTLSFGPILVENGQTSPRSKEFGNTPNPRTAFGMVEPGYYVAVMVESRIEESKGESCVWLGVKMAELGCQSAINLDGGATSCMLFMGKQINKSGNYGAITNRPQNELFGIGYSPAVQ